MEELRKYFDEINAETGEPTGSLQGKEIPDALREFYETFGSVELPYGRIYDLEQAVKNAERIPFFPDWFVFGEDHYFCLWICYKGDDCDGRCFTCWDHESGLEIDEPVWRDLLSFLKEMEEEN